MPSYSVSEVNRFIKQIFAAEDIFYGLHIRGEISNFVNHVRSGHFYFTLKDQTSSIKCVMFRSNASRLPFLPENGMNVILRGDVQVFERDGVYQVYVADIQPDGTGALYMAYEQLKKKLDAEGLFDPQRKRPLPPYPGAIGVITSKTGAALQDILNILRRRYPVCTVKLFPALVQGEQAPESIIQAFARANRTPLDLVIVGRGGGSLEDLWAFNDEGVARAIAGCRVPVISAVGHEVDYTIADFAADLRAPTPSAAAELAVPDIVNLRTMIDNYAEMVYNYTVSSLQNGEQQLDSLSTRLMARAPGAVLEHSCHSLESLDSRLHLSFEGMYGRCGQRFAAAAGILESLSPLKVLTRGYSITFDKSGKIARSAEQLKPGNRITTRFHDGEVVSVVAEKEE